MGHNTFSVESYRQARKLYDVTDDANVTRKAEEKARRTGQLSEIVDPAINPIRFSKIRLDPHQKKWIVTVGCPMDIEVSCDTTGSMGGEVDTEMATLPQLYEAVSQVLPGYDPQLCLGIFGDCEDRFVMCRPQFEMEAEKIVNYLKEMAPQRGGAGNDGEDPQYAMFARAYLTDAYTNHIGLKGYHFIVTDEPCHRSLTKDQLKRVFGDEIFDKELKSFSKNIPSLETMVKELKSKTHQFVLVLRDCRPSNTIDRWRKLCGEKSVIVIDTTRQLPKVISAIIGLTEGTLDITDLKEHLGDEGNARLISQLSCIDIGAQAMLRHNLPHPVPKADDIFLHKEDIWPIQPGETVEEDNESEPSDSIRYL